MSNTPKRIFALGYNVKHTGFTRVMHSILSHLDPKEFEVHYLGIGSGHIMYGERDHVKIYPHDPRKDGDVFRSYLARDLMRQSPPHILFAINDLWMFKAYDRIFESFREQTKFISYTPFDGKLKEPSPLKFFKNNHAFVTYTEFGKRQTEAGLERLHQEQGPMTFPPIFTIPHGVDQGRFFPLGGRPGEKKWKLGRLKAKRKIFRSDLATEDSFIVLNANRPTTRKCIPLTIEGFAHFAKGKPANVKLCLHHALIAPEEKEAIEFQIDKWGLQDRLIWRRAKHPEEHFTDAQMNLLYNACDVGVNTSMGEGWGLVSFEHAATGAAQIVPEHSACKELWQGAAELLPSKVKIDKPANPIQFVKVSAEDVADRLERLYVDRRYLQDMSLKGFLNATKPEYSWHTIGKKWGLLFNQILGLTESVQQSFTEKEHVEV